jgi:Mg/Co/Ni transporter MgtE
MNTEYVAVNEEGTVRDAAEALQGNEDLLETLSAVFLVDSGGALKGVIPLGRLFIAAPGTPLRELVSGPLISVKTTEHRDRVFEIFDKYNLLNLPVVDEEGCLCGVITADDIISVLRQG